MANPTQPDLSNVRLPWTPTSYWRAGDYDPWALVAALKAQDGLADYADDNGNLQARVRLDADADPANTGWWITIPSDVDETEVDAAIAAYVAPPADPVATAADHAAVTAAYLTENLASVGISRDEIEPVMEGMLQLSEQFIPKLQAAIAGWASLTADEKDRILEDLANFALIQMQYTTGLLPTSPPAAPPA